MKKRKGVLHKKPTQCSRLMSFIEEHGSISTMQAILEFGIVNPAARVLELRSVGVPIVTTMTDGVNRFGEHCRYAVYTIDETKEKAV